MEITESLKKRFCKDCNIPIAVYQEPYFKNRLKLYDSMYNTITRYMVFVDELNKYKNEQEYLDEYAKIRDRAIESIKGSEGYKRFIEDDMNKYSVSANGIANKNIYKETNNNREFISIDIVKANFYCLKAYEPEIFDNAVCWEEFISKFTEDKHIINSKYIRQVIMGSCNPKRQITYEKYIMSKLLYNLVNRENFNVVSFTNDEIVLDITGLTDEIKIEIENTVNVLTKYIEVPFKVERFTLHKIYGTKGFCKKIKTNDGYKLKLKALDREFIPYVIRYLNKEDVQKEDNVFYYNGKLANYIDIPKIGVSGFEY